jgi:hypothetical protein
MCENMDDDICFWHFRTRLRKGAATDGINFNGAFTIVTWGCGTSCQLGGVIDRTDGRVYQLPVASLGYLFDRESSLLIVNPEPASYSKDGEIPGWLWREFYVFANGTFRLIHSDRGQETLGVGSLLQAPHPMFSAGLLKALEQTQ